LGRENQFMHGSQSLECLSDQINLQTLIEISAKRGVV
jgi:hypothetical protein